MKFFYTIGIALYTGIAQIMALLGHRKAALMMAGRSHTWQLLDHFQKNNPKALLAWFHAASLGEFEQGRPVIEAFRKAYPHYKILLTFFSPSGYEARKNYAHADLVCYLPADTPTQAKKLVKIINPNIAFFVKYEFWHYYLRELYRQKIPCLSISAIFQPQQEFFKPWGSTSRLTLSYFQHIFVQQENSKQLLAGIDISHVSVIPDTRFDRVYQICQAPQTIPLAKQFSACSPTLVIGSAWEADLAHIAPTLLRWASPLKIILAPHEIGESHLIAMEKQLSGLRTLRYSQANEINIALADVLIIDNIGMLSSLYQYGHWAYIGGGFGKGLHNTLEAATFGLPIIFGPKYQIFQEAVDLVQLQGGFCVHNATDFATIFEQLYKRGSFYVQASNTAKKYVQQNLGGTATIMAHVNQLLVQQQHLS